MQTVATNVGGFITTTVATECACNTGMGDCFGCWDDMNDELAYLLSQWEHYAEGIFIVRGSSVGWVNRNVAEVIEGGCDKEAFISAIAPNGDFTQTWSLDGDQLTVFQTHHDSPTGETFVFEPLTLESFVAAGMDPEDLIDMRVDEIVDEAAMSRHCHSDAGPFSARDAFDVMQHLGAESVDEVFDAARRVARAEWDDDRLRSVRYADLLPELRF